MRAYDNNQSVRFSQISQPVVFFYHKKPASSIFSQPDQPKRIG
jgi:hypothetical protein